MRAKGSQDLLGPSTKRVIDMILAGHTPQESGRYGTTNGAAMRITPVGIAADVTDPQAFIQSVIQACQVTHTTTLGIAVQPQWQRWFRPASTALIGVRH